MAATGPEQPPTAKARRAPVEPTQEERACHVLTHLPYRHWRVSRVRGKARENPHMRGRHAGNLDEVQADYLFMQNRTYADEPTLTILVIVWVDTGAVLATLAVKGVAPYMLKFPTAALDM